MRLSVSTRILAGFVALLLAFSGAAAFAVSRLRGAARDLRVMNQGHLRLAFALNELEATQASLVGLVDGSQTLGLNVLRRMRLLRLSDARRVARDALRLGPRDADVGFLRTMARDLRTLEVACKQSEAAFERLFGPAALPAPPTRAADVADLARREGEVLRLVRAARDVAKGRVTELSLELLQTEERAVWASLALVVAVLCVGVGAAFAAGRTLRPLRQLADGARAIGAGDYARRVEAPSRDEIGALAEEFNRMAAAVEERERRLVRSERLAAAGRVAAHVAHEIRNPLSSIGLNADLLDEEVASAEGKRLLGAIRREIDRLEALTEEYLRFGRLPQPKLETQPLGPLLASLLDFLGQELRDGGIAVRAELRDVPAVAADETQLRQAFLNLLRNAREAMAAGGGGTLGVETDAKNGHVLVRVSDTGPGIPAGARARIFEPFFTTKKGGTGLGLALAQQIVSEHGGRIDVDSAEGRGTTFVVRLPAARS